MPYINKLDDKLCQFIQSHLHERRIDIPLVPKSQLGKSAPTNSGIKPLQFTWANCYNFHILGQLTL